RPARHCRHPGEGSRRADAAGGESGRADSRHRARQAPSIPRNAAGPGRGNGDVNISFQGKTVIVTGAAHGFGRAISLAFAERGANVWACDVVGDELQETAKLCGCETRAVDVRDPEAVQKFVAEASRAAGCVHVLVNNAGGVLGQVGKPIEEVSAEAWQTIFDV